jgi:hypothetical protein
MLTAKDEIRFGGEREQNADQERYGDAPHDRIGQHRKNAIAGERNEFAMGEIDEAHDAEDEADTERGQRIKPAKSERVGNHLSKHRGHDGRACAPAGRPK